MALTLNTSHPLYDNLTAFICVDDDNNIKDLKNPSATFTKDPAVVMGSGSLGRHFRTLSNGYDPTLVNTTGPAIPGSGDISIICVVNNIAGQGGGNPMSLFGGTHGTLFQQGGGGTKWGRWNSGSGSVNFSTESAGTIGNGVHTFCMSRVGSTSHSTYKDGAALSTGGALGNETNSGYIGPFGGEAGQGSVGADYVYVMMFNKALSLAEYQEIHNNLAANNVSTMLGSSGTPVAFTGTVPNQNATVGTPFTLSLASYFSGTLTPFAYSTFAGTLPAGLTRSGDTISGTPSAAGTSSGIQVRATDTGNNTATTNAFSITVSAGADTTPPVITGPGGNTTGTATTSIAENTTAVHTYSANETVTWSLNGGADAARFSINSTSGALSFNVAPDYENPTDANADNVYVVVVRAADSAATPNITQQTLSVTVTNVADNSGSTTTAPMENNTRTGVLGNVAVSWSYHAGARIGSMGGKTLVEGTGTTASDGTLTVSGLPTGSGMLQVVALGATPAQDQVFYQHVTVS